MAKVTISELKNQLSGYLKKVRAGETVLIYDRDQPIARLERVEGSAMPEHVIEMERAGLVRRAKVPVPIDVVRAPAPRPKRSVVQALIDERREDR